MCKSHCAVCVVCVAYLKPQQDFVAVLISTSLKISVAVLISTSLATHLGRFAQGGTYQSREAVHTRGAQGARDAGIPLQVHAGAHPA